MLDYCRACKLYIPISFCVHWDTEWNHTNFWSIWNWCLNLVVVQNAKPDGYIRCTNRIRGTLNFWLNFWNFPKTWEIRRNVNKLLKNAAGMTRFPWTIEVGSREQYSLEPCMERQRYSLEFWDHKVGRQDFFPWILKVASRGTYFLSWYLFWSKTDWLPCGTTSIEEECWKYVGWHLVKTYDCICTYSRMMVHASSV